MSSDFDAFDFEIWIKENAFSEIKHLFIQHGMLSVSSLSTQSERFLSFIASVSSERPEFVAEICRAFQCLQLEHAETQHVRTKSIVSEHEFAAKESIEDQIQKLQEITLKLQEAHKQCMLEMEKHKERHKNIGNIQLRIQQKFDAIQRETDKHKTNITKQCNRFKNDHETQSEAVQQRAETLKKMMDDIEAERRFEHEQLLRVSELLEDDTLQRQQRETQII